MGFGSGELGFTEMEESIRTHSSGSVFVGFVCEFLAYVIVNCSARTWERRGDRMPRAMRGVSRVVKRRRFIVKLIFYF